MIKVIIDTDDDFHVKIKGITITGSSEVTFYSKKDFNDAIKKAKITYVKQSKENYAAEFLYKLKNGISCGLGNYSLSIEEVESPKFFILEYSSHERYQWLLTEKLTKKKTIAFLKEKLDSKDINELAFSYKHIKLGEVF
ncbi:MAG: hypothetical protein E6R13_06630 [Spirochaetes bacterium]|nr:MAG: hypothetical protein E6R13_06630 [Spirochaetota bacterium]